MPGPMMQIINVLRTLQACCHVHGLMIHQAKSCDDEQQQKESQPHAVQISNLSTFLKYFSIHIP